MAVCALSICQCSFICSFQWIDIVYSCCSSFIADSQSSVSSAVRTEANVPPLIPSQPCRSSGLLQRKSSAVENGSVVKYSLPDVDGRSLSAAGRSMSAMQLPAGDLLVGPRHCGHSTDR